MAIIPPVQSNVVQAVSQEVIPSMHCQASFPVLNKRKPTLTLLSFTSSAPCTMQLHRASSLTQRRAKFIALS